jgi:hypothetical protein
MRLRAAYLPILLVTAVIATATACGTAHRPVTLSRGAPPTPAPSAATSAGGGYTSFNTNGNLSEQTVNGADVNAAAGAGSSRQVQAAQGLAPGAPAASVPSAAPSKLLASRALVQTADITVKVSLISAADQVDAIATQAGAAIDGDDRTSGKGAVATIILEVPPRALATVLAAVAKLGTEQARNLDTQDVTTQVADVTSRVRSARDAITRLQALFDQASGINDVITVEGQLEQRQANLESLEAQQRALASQTATAKLTVHLTTASPAPTAAPAKRHHGFAGGLGRGWHNFTGFVTSTLTAVGLIGPFAILVALVAILGVVLVARIRQQRRSAVPGGSVGAVADEA